MPFAAVNGIDVYFELHGTGPPLLNISGSGNDLRRSPASILPVNKAFETLSWAMVEQSKLPPDPEQLTGLARQLRDRAGHP